MSSSPAESSSSSEQLRSLFTPRTGEALADWFDREAEAYPWTLLKEEGQGRIYAVWVSEVMLQQTAVKAAVPFFLAWMERFPTVEALAGAGEEAVLRAWEGLGYYSRARNLHRAARQVVQEGGGVFPEDYEGWRRLPGVGDYTARAVLSLALGEPLPVIDANVKRILQRLTARRGWDGVLEREGLGVLEDWLSGAADPGKLNGAMMQLGQLVCRRRDPLCGGCPLAGGCRAEEEGVQGEIPPVQRRRVTELETEVWVIRRGDGRLLVARREGEVLGRLWTFPRREPGSFRRLPAGLLQPAGELQGRTHTYTSFRDRLIPLAFGAAAGASGDQGRAEGDVWLGPAGEELRWVSPGELEQTAMPAVYRKIAREAEKIFST